ncbi:copia protein [Tanacetum coccineum]|uniref:Copia protein n=1 Tax=Tanacetum coccineum TaxID=301880 RepID=A0ABQ4ZE99_9ASTR
MKRNLQDRADDIALWEAFWRKFENSSTSNTSCREDDFPPHHDEHQNRCCDAPPVGENKSDERSKSKKDLKWDAWEEENVVDEDEVIPEDVTPELIAEFIMWSIRVQNYVVRKEFKTFNEDARLSIQHWKDSWHKRVYKQNQKKVRKNTEDYYSNQRITEVVRIVTDQPHGLDFMKQILVMRANDKPDSFSKADFKYLNKSDIEDLYYLCRSKEIDNQKVKLMNSLITFIRSCVIWERVHDFQLGIESYQMKVNLTAPTLTFPDEKRIMYLEEIVKFCDATLEKVLNEVKLRMFESKFLKKPPLLAQAQTQSSEPPELVSEPVVNESNVECQPKVWSDAPIIEEYELDSEDEYVSLPTKEQEHLDYPHRALQNKGIVDNGCFKHMTGNKAYLAKYQDFNGGPCCFWIELQHFNLFYVSQICDKKNKVLFTDSECLVLSPKFKLPDENQVLLRIPRQNNMYSFNLENIVPSGSLACLIAKATIDESNKWHRRLGHVNFKNLKPKLCEGKPCPQEANQNAGTKDIIDAGDFEKEDKYAQDYFVLPIWSSYSSIVKRSIEKDAGDAPNKHPNLKTNGKPVDKEDQEFAQQTEDLLLQAGAAKPSNVSWVDAMQEELLQFKIQKVWILVDLPYRKKAIGTKWVYRNKKDKRGVMVRNKEGIEAIRIFLAFASYMGFIVYQMDVKSAFLYGKIDEEVYVSQPSGFIHSKYPQKVYKAVEKGNLNLFFVLTLPKAWYATLSTFLLKNGYRRGTIDKTLFIKKDKHDIILVQVYVDDIIFGSTKKSWCDEFEALMKSRFQMSYMGELTFSLGLQVTPKTSHLSAVKRIFRYLKGKPKLGLWYPRVSSFDLEAYSDSGYAGANLDKKSTTGEGFMDAACKLRPVGKFCRFNIPMHFDVVGYVLVVTFGNVQSIKHASSYGWLYGYKLSTTSEQLVPLAKLVTAIETLKNIPPWHNMVAYLEKTEGNAEFHEVIDFLARSSIPSCYSLYINAKVAGTPVSISKASIRSDLLFDDADGIDSLPNQAIFDVIQLMGYEGDLTVLTFNKALFSPNGVNVPVPLDHFPVNALTSKVFSFMVKKGKHFSGKVTPLFAFMLVQSTEDEGATSERPSEPQPTPSPPHPSEANVEPPSDPSPRPSPTPHIPNSIPEVFCIQIKWGFRGGISILENCWENKEVTDQSKEIKTLKAQIKKLKKQAKPVISHHRAWMKSLSLKQRLGRKSAKAEPSVRKDLLFDELDDNEIDNMDTKDAQDVGRSRDVVNEENENADAEVSTKDVLEFQEKRRKGVDTVEFKDVEETERPRTTSTRSLLTLKPLPKIDPKDKGKKKIEEEDESETESEGIPEAEKKFKQLASDEEMARKIEVDGLLAERLQEQEREQFTVEERAKFLHDTIHSQLKTKKFEEIQALYEKIKRSDEDFIAIGSAEDERMIKEMNEKGIDSSKNESVKEEGKEEEGTKKRKSGHIKMITRKKPRKQSDDDSDDEHRRCLKIVTFEGTLDSEIMEKKSVIARLDKVSSPDGDYLVLYRANGNFRAFNYLMEVLYIFDRQDLFHLYELMMEQYSEITLEGFELILWGDLKIMMESSTEENDQSDFWSNQQDWKIITWRLYEACGVCILELEDGIVIHMLVERRYPLSKELLQRMLDLGLEVERESYVALDLIRFIKQQIDEE